MPRHARRLSLSSSPEKGRARCKGGEEGIRRAKKERRRVDEERRAEEGIYGAQKEGHRATDEEPPSQGGSTTAPR